VDTEEVVDTEEEDELVEDNDGEEVVGVVGAVVGCGKVGVGLVGVGSVGVGEGEVVGLGLRVLEVDDLLGFGKLVGMMNGVEEQQSLKN